MNWDPAIHVLAHFVVSIANMHFFKNQGALSAKNFVSWTPEQFRSSKEIANLLFLDMFSDS
jgi:hypothetical protein